jgi:RND family efflux transporter MFP subunit
VRAPFDGIVSVRNAQIGQLVNAGSNTAAQTELFHIVQVDRLRVYANVPEALATRVKIGLAAELALEAVPGHRFQGTVTRTANAIRPSTRTLEIEIDVDNPTGALLAGSYARVRLSVPADDHVFVLPIEGLLFRKDGLTVAKVVAGRVVLAAIRAGRDLGDRIEIVDGVNDTDAIIVNPPDSITAGDPVRIAAP